MNDSRVLAKYWGRLILYKIFIIVIVSMKLTTISIKPETYRRLKELGYMGESFDHLVLRILDKVDKKNGDKRQLENFENCDLKPLFESLLGDRE
jgi:predicted CopG family antitoxin